MMRHAPAAFLAIAAALFIGHLTVTAAAKLAYDLHHLPTGF